MRGLGGVWRRFVAESGGIRLASRPAPRGPLRIFQIDKLPTLRKDVNLATFRRVLLYEIQAGWKLIHIQARGKITRIRAGCKIIYIQAGCGIAHIRAGCKSSHIQAGRSKHIQIRAESKGIHTRLQSSDIMKSTFCGFLFRPRCKGSFIKLLLRNAEGVNPIRFFLGKKSCPPKKHIISI